MQIGGEIMLFARLFLMALISSIFFCVDLSMAGGSNSIIIGFVDDGEWGQKGSILIEAKFASSLKRDSFNRILNAEHSKEIASKKTILLSDDMFRFFTFGKGEILSVYSSAGLLGVFNVQDCILLVNHCGGGEYPYFRLNGRLDNSTSKTVVATKGKTKFNVYPLTDTFKLNNITDVLTKTLEKNLVKFEGTLKEIKKEEGEDPSFFLTRKEVVYQPATAKHGDSIFVNAVWEWASKSTPESSYYITNTFEISSTNQKIDLLPANICFLSTKVIPSILFGIDTDKDGNLELVIHQQAWEGQDVIVIEWDGKQFKEIYRSNYFGC